MNNDSKWSFNWWLNLARDHVLCIIIWFATVGFLSFVFIYGMSPYGIASHLGLAGSLISIVLGVVVIQYTMHQTERSSSNHEQLKVTMEDYISRIKNTFDDMRQDVRDIRFNQIPRNELESFLKQPAVTADNSETFEVRELEILKSGSVTGSAEKSSLADSETQGQVRPEADLPIFINEYLSPVVLTTIFAVVYCLKYHKSFQEVTSNIRINRSLGDDSVPLSFAIWGAYNVLQHTWPLAEYVKNEITTKIDDSTLNAITEKMDKHVKAEAEMDIKVTGHITNIILSTCGQPIRYADLN